ncbi:MAG: PEGA domain-containing protein [Deltaproteobacteria bacterium]|nr:PEGA domain-containing protein [Deltaproteobacteria bacterium]
MAAAGGAAVVVAALLGAAAADHERYAVLPVDTAKDGAPRALEAARAVRAALRSAGLDVLEEDATRAPLRAHLSRGGAPLAVYQERMAQSEAALAALEQDKVVRILETLVSDLVADQEPTVEKLQLLEQARLRLAARLLGIGGKRETGRAETPEGKRAHRLLLEALRARPTLAPSKDEFPARLFTLLDGARAALDAQGRGGLHVDSRPRGAVVYLEGRDIGRTPLVLGADALPLGEYRLWLAVGGAHSVPTRVQVEPAPQPLLVDLAFDGALWPEGPGLRPVQGASIDEDVAKTVGGVLGADVLVLVGTDARPGDAAPSLWGTAFSVASARAARRGAVPLPDGASVDEAAVALGRYLTGSNDATGVQEQALPATVLPPRKPVAATQVPEGEFPWLTVALVAGGVGAVVLAGAGVAAAVLSIPKSGAYTVTVVELEAAE